MAVALTLGIPRKVADHFSSSGRAQFFFFVVAIAFSADRVTQTIIEPLVRADTLDRVLAPLPDGLTLVATPFADARDIFIDIVWTHLRRGGDALPVALAGHV